MRTLFKAAFFGVVLPTQFIAGCASSSKLPLLRQHQAEMVVGQNPDGTPKTEVVPVCAFEGEDTVLMDQQTFMGKDCKDINPRTVEIGGIQGRSTALVEGAKVFTGVVGSVGSLLNGIGAVRQKPSKITLLNSQAQLSTADANAANDTTNNTAQWNGDVSDGAQVDLTQSDTSGATRPGSSESSAQTSLSP